MIWSADDNKATFVVTSVDNLYADPCDPLRQLRDPAVGPSVDDLVAALAAVPGWEFSAPTDIVVDGFAGQYVEYVSSTPSGDCADPWLWNLNNSDPPDQPAPTGDDVSGIRIIDVDGTRLVITTNSFPPSRRTAWPRWRK